MTNERAKEILKRYTTRIRSLEEHAFPDLEETEALFVAYKALEQLERLEDLKKLEKKPEPIPIIQTSDGTVWPLSVFEPKEPTPEDWAKGAEVSKGINELINGIDWLKRCLTCQYYYTKQDDAETVYCRARTPGCNYKPAKQKKGGREE